MVKRWMDIVGSVGGDEWFNRQVVECSADFNDHANCSQVINKAMVGSSLED